MFARSPLIGQPAAAVFSFSLIPKCLTICCQFFALRKGGVIIIIPISQRIEAGGSSTRDL